MTTGKKLAAMMTMVGINLQSVVDMDEPEKLIPPIEELLEYESFDVIGKLNLAKMFSETANDCAKLALLMAFIEDQNSKVFAMVGSLFDQAANLIMDDLGIPA